MAGPKIELLDDLPARGKRQEIVAGLIAEGEIVLLIGLPGSGKSAVAQLMAYSVAQGEPFLGLDTTAGPAVYLAAERDEALPERFEALAGEQIGKLRSKNIFAFAVLADLVGDVSEITAQVGAIVEEPRLIVLDTLAGTIFGLDENSTKDMGRVVKALTEITSAFPTAALVVVHHTGKGDTSARGSSALQARADLELHVRRKNAPGTVTVEKANRIRAGRKLNFDLLNGPPAVRAIEAGQSPSIARVKLREPELHGLAALREVAGPGESVPLSVWREHFMPFVAGKKSDNQRRCWKDAQELLQERGAITISSDRQTVSVNWCENA